MARNNSRGTAIGRQPVTWENKLHPDLVDAAKFYGVGHARIAADKQAEFKAQDKAAKEAEKAKADKPAEAEAEAKPAEAAKAEAAAAKN